ncbi:hypothetical protein Glove_81g54 [Diversispora epigaea]|uniref:Transcription initiation factor IIF subunit alpha n=1 Tax=Diversispora epigaea TaxID=1348612 RepID=A0A397JHN7_9GLOM|nr:hypothetical protein Glove_81g54 [Diversispora epigaea]
MTSPNRPSPTSVRPSNPSNPQNPQNALTNSNRSPTPGRPPTTVRTSLVHNQNNQNINVPVPPLPCPQPPRPIAPNLAVRPPRPPAGRFPVRNMAQASQPQLTLKAEFIITPSSLVGKKKINIMRLKSGQPVDLTKFNAPIKLHRRDPDAPTQNGGINNNNNNNNNMIIMNNRPTQNTVAAPINNKPTSEVTLTAIAPYAGARQNKKNLFKKKTTQVFLADPKTRELKAEEHIPWVLEDFGGENVFVGSYIGGDTAKYCVFLKQVDKLRFVPVHRFYEFQRKIKHKILTIEEAEEQMARAKKMESDRWMMRKFGKVTEAEDITAKEGIYDPKSSIKTVENEEDLFGSDEEHRPSREGFDEEMDYDEIFEDDEEDLPDDANPLIDDETKEVGKLKAKVKHPFELDNQTSDEEEKLTSEGKQMKKLIRTHDDNDAYESDRESNPYATESDVTDSEDTSSISKQSSTTGPSSNKASPVMKTEKISEKGKSPSKSKVVKTATPKNRAPANVKPKLTVEKPKPKSKQKQVSPKTSPPNKAKSAETVNKPKLQTEKFSKLQIDNQKTLSKEITQKAKPVKPPTTTTTPTPTPMSKVTSVSTPTSKFTSVPTPTSTSKPSTTTNTPNASPTIVPEKRALSSDPTSSEIENTSSSKKRSRSSNVQKPTPVTTPTSARSANTSPNSLTSPEEGGPSKKQKISKTSSISRQPGTSSAPSGSNLITEREIKELILTKNVKVNDLIRTFKNRIREDSRNRDRLLSITKEIAVYKEGYLALK